MESVTVVVESNFDLAMVRQAMELALEDCLGYRSYTLIIPPTASLRCG